MADILSIKAGSAIIYIDECACFDIIDMSRAITSQTEVGREPSLSYSSISEELTSFIHSNIDSVEQLEILRHLHNESRRPWSPRDLSDLLYIQENSAQLRLDKLTTKGLCRLVDADRGLYCYDGDDPVRDRLVREMLHVYKIRRAAVITLIFSQTKEP